MKQICIKYYWLLTLAILLVSRSTYAQISIQPAGKKSAGTIVMGNLKGNGVKISKVKFNGVEGALNAKKSVQFGTFTNNEKGFPGFFSSGIILCTGDCMMAEGPNNIDGKTSLAQYYPPNKCIELEKIVAPYSVNQPAILEFDFSSITKHVQFRYVFASEEYPRFSCSEFNDVFGFFVTDNVSGITKNIALIPGTDKAVSVNNIHPDYGEDCKAVNEQYLTMLPTGSKKMQFNGFVGPFIAEFDLEPNRTYHIKLAISNVSDLDLESAVFIEAASFNAVDDNGLVVGKNETPEEPVKPTVTHTLSERNAEEVPLENLKKTSKQGIFLKKLDIDEPIDPNVYIITAETDHDILFDTIGASINNDSVYLYLHLRNRLCDCFVPEKIHATVVLTPKSNNGEELPHKIVIPYAAPIVKDIPWLTRCFWVIVTLVALLLFMLYLQGLLRKSRFKKTARMENSYVEDENSRKEVQKKGRLLREKGFLPWLNRWFNPFTDERCSMSFTRPKTKQLTLVAGKSKESVLLTKACHDEKTMIITNYVPQPEGSGPKEKYIRITSGEQIEIRDRNRNLLGHLTFTANGKDDEGGYRLFVGVLFAVSAVTFVTLAFMTIKALL